jgi:hypothetical protein
VHLAFAFDVSGSMGQGDEPWHDRTLKWDPDIRGDQGIFRRSGFARVLRVTDAFPRDRRGIRALHRRGLRRPGRRADRAALDGVRYRARRHPDTALASGHADRARVARGFSASSIGRRRAGRDATWWCWSPTAIRRVCSNNRIVDVVNVVSQRAMTIRRT